MLANLNVVAKSAKKKLVKLIKKKLKKYVFYLLSFLKISHPIFVVIHKSILKPSFPLLCSCILLVHSRTPALQLAFYVTFFVRIEKIDELLSHSPRQELQINIKQFQHK